MRRTDLHAYQRGAVEFILDHPRCQLWLEMGLGKTVATLTAVSDLYERGEIARALVLAPLRVARHVWSEEVERWEHTRWMGVQVIAGAPEARRRQLRADAHIHVVNYDLLPWLAEELAGRWPYDMVIADEFSRLKSRSTQRWKALRRQLPRIERLVGLTGTPAANGLLDLWAPTFLLDGGARLGKSFTAYKARWFHPLDPNGWRWKPFSGAEEEIKGRLADVTLAMRSRDYLELPPKVVNTLQVDLPPRCRGQYRQLEREMFLELSKEQRITAVNAGALISKCAQYANGALYVEGDPVDGERPWEEVHTAKLDALEEVIEEAAGEPVLVGYAFRSDLARLKRRFPQARDIYEKNGDVVAAWNRGEVPILLGHPASMGHGLNLQAGGRILAWLGLPWSLELYEQMVARLYRQGQARPTLVQHIVTRGTVDDQILDALEGKRTLQDSLVDAMRRAA